MVHYPAPEHRTAALAHQAALLYLALYFAPGVLHREATLMRTLVDRCAQTLLLSLLLSAPLPAKAVAHHALESWLVPLASGLCGGPCVADEPASRFPLWIKIP